MGRRLENLLFIKGVVPYRVNFSGSAGQAGKGDVLADGYQMIFLLDLY